MNPATSQTADVGRRTLTLRLARVAGVLAASFFAGVVVVSIGAGSALTSLNTIMSPLVCPGEVIVPAWEYRGPRKLAHGPDLATRWICVDETSHVAHVEGYRTIFTAGTVYGLIIAIGLGLSLRLAASSGEARAARSAATRER